MSPEVGAGANAATGDGATVCAWDAKLKPTKTSKTEEQILLTFNGIYSPPK